MIPYNKQKIDQSDIDAVTNCLLSDYLTTGPLVEQFESAICNYTGARYCAVVSSGTAAIQCALFAAGVGPGDEVILPDMTFVGVANCIVNLGATPVFCDVFEDTMLINHNKLYSLITSKTKAIIGMDYTGVPADYDQIKYVISQMKVQHITVIADAAHSFGASDNGIKVGHLADMTCFSFHPVKTITSAEGGAVVTSTGGYYRDIRKYRNHGIDKGITERTKEGHRTQYDVMFAGYNFRLSDIHCALGISQIDKVDNFLIERKKLANLYCAYINDSNPNIGFLNIRHGVKSANHLFVGKLKTDKPRIEIIKTMEGLGIQLGVHYPSITKHMFRYKGKFWRDNGASMPIVSHRESEKLISLPLFVDMTYDQVIDVCEKLNDVLSK